MHLRLPTSNIIELPSGKFPEVVEEQARRLDFRDEIFVDREPVQGFTIDAEESMDLDDAIHLKQTPTGWLAQVTISDVDSLVSRNSYVDYEALSRVSTQYYGKINQSGERQQFSIPMLPRVLSENRLSLHEGKRRPTMTVQIALNTSGKILKIDIIQTYLSSSSRLSHQEYEGTRIMGDPGLPMNTYLKFAKMLAANRWSEGSLAFQQLKQGINTDEEGMIRQGSVAAANQIVQEFMILANRAIALFFKENNIPAPFRIHQASDGLAPTRQQIIEEVERSSDYLVLVDNLRSIYNKYLSGAVYSSVPGRHFGLSLPAYLHFTSPIRRYADLINHRIARAIITEDAPPYSAEEMTRLCHYLNERERRLRTLRSIQSGQHSFHIYKENHARSTSSIEKPESRDSVVELMAFLSEHRLGNPIFEFSAKPGIHIKLTCKAALRFQKRRYTAEFSAHSDKTTVKNIAARRLLKIIKSVYKHLPEDSRDSAKYPDHTQNSEIRNQKPVGKLFQYCRDNHLPSPNFHYEIWSGGITPITCHCQITNELAVIGHGPNRLQSKHSAAQKLLDYLQSKRK